MAGSYNHIVTDTGAFNTEAFKDGMIENLGDAHEMAEEMYGMIWYLANDDPNPAMKIDEARRNYQDGLKYAPKTVDGDPHA